jgi:hypothetical protein
MNTDILKKNYYDVSLPGAYAGLDTFYNTIKLRGIKISKEELKNWLSQQESYIYHFPVKKIFKRLSYSIRHKDDLWQADLCDYSNIKEYNNNYKYILTVIDIFSKYAFAIPIERKNAENIIDAFKTIFKGKRFPKKIHTDEVIIIIIN